MDAVFWNKEFWLPASVKWEDIDGSDSNLQDLFISICLCFLILFTRYHVEKFLLRPLGIALGIKNIRTKAVKPNAYLERVWKKSNQKDIRGWAKQLEWTEREVQNWITLRKNQDKLTQIDKFCESGWRFLYMCFISSFGLFALWESAWLWDVEDCWRNYPRHLKTGGVWWYYMIAFAYYLSVTISQFYDNKRSDFWPMFVHHIITVYLIATSWITGFFKIGSLIMLILDVTEIGLEAAKTSKYAGFMRLSYTSSICFLILWITNRLIVFPFWILRSTIFESHMYFKISPALTTIGVTLLMLMCLHLFWTVVIAKILQKAVREGKLNDVRSSSSEADD